MIRTAGILQAILWVMLACSTESSLRIDPDTDDFELDPTTTAKIEQEAEDGDGAQANFEYDETDNTITVTITSSSFDCGIEKGSFVAEITELNATTMKWEFVDGDGEVVWTRLDEGTSGVVGVWETTDPSLFLILAEDGRAQIFGQGEECEPERKRNDQNCLETVVSTAAISIDGDLSDWDAVGVPATLTDEIGDHTGDDQGADLRALKTAFSGNFVYVYLQLAGVPSTNFQNGAAPKDGAYRITIQGYNGLSFQESVFYDVNSETWSDGGHGAAEVSFAVGDDGIEWQVDISRFMGEGFSEVDFIMVEAMGFSTNSRIDEMDCAWFKLP